MIDCLLRAMPAQFAPVVRHTRAATMAPAALLRVCHTFRHSPPFSSPFHLSALPLCALYSPSCHSCRSPHLRLNSLSFHLLPSALLSFLPFPLWFPFLPPWPISGQCTCATGWATCATGPCTTDVTSDPDNCGSCGTVCTDTAFRRVRCVHTKK